MSAPRCKIGDRVIVIAPTESAVLGWFGIVRGEWDQKSDVGGQCFYITGYEHVDRTWWIVELSGPTQLHTDDGTRVTVRRVPYPDVWLQLIRGNMPAVDQEVEKCLTAS